MKKIAYIDDCNVSVEYMKQIITSNGHICYDFKYIDDIINELPNMEVDIVISDFIMFDMDGLTLISLLRDLLPNHVKYVLCTSYKSQTMAEFCQLQNILLINKPFNRDNLFQIIESE